MGLVKKLLTDNKNSIAVHIPEPLFGVSADKNSRKPIAIGDLFAEALIEAIGGKEELERIREQIQNPALMLVKYQIENIKNEQMTDESDKEFGVSFDNWEDEEWEE